MATDPRYQPITADQFLEMDFATDRKFELSNGVIQMMTGGSELHAWVLGNLTGWLRWRLRGSGCRSYGSEMGVRLSDVDVRYPDVSIYCGPRPEHGAKVKALTNPVVVMEVLSPTTATYDQSAKLAEYQALASIDLIVFVDAVRELLTVHRRANGCWPLRGTNPDDLALGIADLTIPHAEIFARD